MKESNKNVTNPYRVVKAYRAKVVGTVTKYMGDKKHVIPITSESVHITPDFKVAMQRVFKSPLFNGISFDRDNSYSMSRSYFLAEADYDKNQITITELTLVMCEVYNDASEELVRYDT